MRRPPGQGRIQAALTLAGVGALLVAVALWTRSALEPSASLDPAEESLRPSWASSFNHGDGPGLVDPEGPGKTGDHSNRSGAPLSGGASGPRVHGVLIRRSTTDPLPNLRLFLEQRDSILASTRPDPSGNFAWDRTVDPDEGPAFVSFGLPRGWCIEVHGEPVPRTTFALEEAEMRGERALRISLLRLAPAPLRVVVVDEASRDALPNFRVQVGNQIYGSDREGRFETRDLAHGRHTLQPIGDPGSNARYRSHSHFHDVRNGAPKPIEIEVAAGPSYRLDVPLPAGYRVEHFRARLREVRISGSTEGPASAPGDSILADPVLAYGLAGQDPRSGVVVRDALPPWVRFSPVRESLAYGGPPWWLVLNSVDGLWVGAAKVDRIEGSSPEPIAVQLHAFGRLEGLVMSPSGALIRGAKVRAIQLDADPNSGSIPSFEGHGEHFLIQGMPSGVYRIETRAPRYRDDLREVTLVAGEPTLVDIHLEQETLVGDIEGKVTWESGISRSTPRLELRSIRDPDRVFSPGHRRILEEGRWVQRFEFTSLPEDDYELVYFNDSTWDVELPSGPLQPPVDDLVVRVFDGGPSAYFYVEASDADSGEPIMNLEAQPSFGARISGGLGHLSLGRHPLDSKLLWRIQASGYLDRSLSIADFTEIVEEEDPIGDRTARVELEPGWEVLLRVLDARGDPAFGVEVELLGRPVGTSDERGECALVVESRPEHLVLRRSGSVLTTTVPELPGQLPARGEGGWRTVHLAP